MVKLKAAVIGCGGAGQNHARAYARASGTRLVAVCDIDPARAEAAATQWGGTAYTSLEEMLLKERPEVVSVATREYDHDGPTIAALEAGAHVLCEKIMAHSLAAGEAMVAAARRTGRMLAVDYNYRHMPAFAFIKQRLEAGDLGAPVLLVAQTHCYCWHHMLDLLRFFLGNPTAVQAALVDDPACTPYAWHSQEELLYIPSVAVSATFQFDSGAVATIASTMHTPLEEHMIDLSLYGEKARVSLNRVRPANTRGQPGPGPLADGLRALPKVTLSRSFDLSVGAFVAALQDGRRPPTTGEDGLAILRMEHAVVRSAREGRPVQLEC